jgi:hypothetical protein
MASFSASDDAPAMRLHSTGTEISDDIGTARAAPIIHGPRTSLLAWWVGRARPTHPQLLIVARHEK